MDIATCPLDPTKRANFLEDQLKKNSISTDNFATTINAVVILAPP
jgi:hypothetical protein